MKSSQGHAAREMFSNQDSSFAFFMPQFTSSSLILLRSAEHIPYYYRIIIRPRLKMSERSVE